MAGIFKPVGMRLIPGYWPVYTLAALSIIGAVAMQFLPVRTLVALFDNRWSLAYLLFAPFLHGGLFHVFLNILMLHYIGGQLLLPILGARRFLIVFTVSALAGELINNLVSTVPAIGISAGVLGMLACSVYPYGRLPMKLLLIHDILRLRPFPLWTVAAFVVFLDILGLVFSWGFFAHGAHLAGFAAGAGCGWWFFKRPPGWPGWGRKRVVH